MFKFDFDLQDAEELDILNLGTAATNTESQAPIDGGPVLEPFSEVSVTQLVRAILSTSEEIGPDSTATVE